MTDDEGQAGREMLLAMLESSSPRLRMRSARLLGRLLDDDERRRVTQLVQVEPIPQIKVLLERLLVAEATTRQIVFSPAAIDHSSGEDLAKLIIHELSPAIGRLELEASEAIADYEHSETARAVSKLKQRLNAVAKIASSRRERIESGAVNLIEAAQLAAGNQPLAVVEVVPEDADEDYFVLSTDADLLSLMLDAAMNNATESQEQVDSSSPILIEVSGSDVSISISITNRMVGGNVNKEQILAQGRTTKFGKRGTGTRAIEGAALGLGVEWDFQATAGVATFSVRFERS